MGRRGTWGGFGGRYCRNRARQAFNSYWRQSHPKGEPNGCLTSVVLCIGVAAALIALLISSIF